MGKRNATEHNGGPNNKRAKLNGHGHHNGDITACELTPNSKDSPKPEYQLSRDLVNGTILTDITQKKWRIGKPIGKGSFGEIFLASDEISSPVTSEKAKYVVKIEPHSNGPLFVEIHCLLNTAKNSENDPLPLGMPEYIASGSHYFKNTRYRFLILQRFDRDLYSIIKKRRVDQKSVLILAVQILEVLEHLHDKGYCHSDIKAENLMISKCTFRSNPVNSESSSSDEESLSTGEDDDDYDDDDDDDEALSNEDDDSDAGYKTPNNKKKIQYSGSNPVRSCRVKRKRNSTYQELVKTHYLRPAKKINYTEFFGDENSKSSEDATIDAYLTRNRIATMIRNEVKRQNSIDLVTEDRIFLIDFGLASKFVDSSGAHRPFCMDQRRAHDGTLEFTSRDAHMGAHSRRSDLECLGYNLIFWSQGYLPWKENAAQNQQEKVHWMKEYLMADVKEMLKHIYGKSVPKYLGEYMQYVNKLAYDERPDYKKCKRIFQREFVQLGYKKDKMILNINELIKNSVDIKEEIENNNVFEMKNIKSIMKNLGMIMPFRESNSNRVSPKNLRSKSEKGSKKKRKKFSWAEILSQDPDQIARERAEKEFEREQTTETPLIRYSGKPTYAILEIENRLKFKDRLEHHEEDPEVNDVAIKGYTKPMMEVLKKRQSSLLAQFEDVKKQHNNSMVSSNKKNSANRVSRSRTKAGLRTVIIPTKRALDYSFQLDQRRAKRSHKNSGDFTDESSCSSMNSIASSNATGKNSNGTINSSLRSGATNSSCTSGLSDEDTRDVMGVFSPMRTRHATTTINNKTTIEAVNGTVPVQAGNRRKKRTPMKRNSKVKKKRKFTAADEEEDDDDFDDDNSSDSDFVVDESEDDQILNDDYDQDDGSTWKKRAVKRKIKRTRSG